jgi:hypothetical protein
MDPQLEKFLFSIGSIVVIGIVAYVGYLMLLSTPAGRGLNQFMGGVGAILGAFGAQLTTCATNGMFGKGCYLGYGGIAVGVAYLIAMALAFFKVGINARIAAISAEKNQSDKQSIDDVVNEGPDLDEVMKDMETRGLTPKAQDAALAKINLRTSSKILKAEIAKQGLNPEELKAKLAEVDAENAEAVDAFNEDLDENKNEIADSDEVAETYVPDF